MIPPKQLSYPTEIGEYWRDDQIVLFLYEFLPGSRLPNNVIEDSSPYLYPPANLPEGIWYLVQSNARKESDSGFWKANDEPCKIYSNSMINGWRTTLQYFEGQTPHGKRTNWLMQEYKITGKELFDKNNIKESRSLCRVFLCTGNASNSEMYVIGCESLVEPKQKKSVALSISNTHISEAKEKDSEVKSLSVADKEPKSFLENSSEQECFLRGDFLELNDLKPFLENSSEQECFLRGDFLELNDLELEDPASHSSSSQNSSCPSKLSDEYFDSLALLRDLEDEDNKYKHKNQSSSTYFFTTSSVWPNDVVIQPDSSGCLVSGGTSTSVLKSSPTCSTSHGMLTDGKEAEHNTSKRRKPDNRIEGTSISSNEATSPTSHKNNMPCPNGEKKTSSGRMKKLKMYFCFLLF